MSVYLAWSRDPAVALLAVVPLWMLYELLRLNLAPEERNGAEALVTNSLLSVGPGALLFLKVLLGFCVLAAGVSVIRRDVPWVRVAAVSALEGSVYGLMLGPITQALSLFVLEGGALSTQLGADIVGSLGAGIFEEAFFRLGMLSLLSLAMVRACEAFSLPRVIGVILAVLVSALAFSTFHHIGIGRDHYDVRIFTFRAVAGVVLGVLFVLRGFSVVVYTHAIYDVHYYLTHS